MRFSKPAIVPHQLLQCITQGLALDMDADNTSEEVLTPFYIGQHETKRDAPVSDTLWRQAADYGVGLPLHDRNAL